MIDAEAAEPTVTIQATGWPATCSSLDLGVVRAGVSNATGYNPALIMLS